VDAALVQLIIALAPVVKDIVVEGTKHVISLRSDMTTDQIIAALETAKQGFPDMPLKPTT
jgi:hypothetical protein